MRSSRPSERKTSPEIDVPASPEDVAALRRARQAGEPDVLPLDRLQPPELFGPWPPRLTTAQGRRPFELD